MRSSRGHDLTTHSICTDRWSDVTNAVSFSTPLEVEFRVVVHKARKGDEHHSGVLWLLIIILITTCISSSSGQILLEKSYQVKVLRRWSEAGFRLAANVPSTFKQVYVVRGVHGQTLPSGHVTRQTVMHVIYKIPFNYPKARKPISIAEGVVSHCWNKDANTQVGPVSIPV